MAHFALTRIGGWVPLSVPTAADFNDFDAKTAASINGDGGGAYAPTTIITIGGLGIAFTTVVNVANTATVSCAGAFNLTTGGLFTAQSGSSLTVAEASGLQLGGTSFPSFTAPRTRVVLQPLVLGGISNMSSGLGIGVTSTGTGASARMMLTALHNGATLSAITITRNYPVRTTIPAVPPSIAINRTNVTTGFQDSVLASTVATGFSNSTASNTFAVSGPNNVIDTSTYFYELDITDESGAGAVAGTLWFSPRITFSAIADLRFA